MSDNKYRVGIIGCGSIANLHVRGYRGVESVEIVAIADPVEAALEEFGNRYNLPIVNRYLDAREMLDKEHLDIVSVATWHQLHAPMTIAACARKPKAVLCEKPMATTLGECDEMLIVARRNGVKVAIAHQRRFN
ncbi:Gfo/Idh/MocA family oxidoreductase, partial [Candidatus Poribacteria bacterium]|nr:Gfo/Idh/MocA family oxidoreductase [Candidatus Poribacteria bacterium]